MLVLLTRPRGQAVETALVLRTMGHKVLIDPLLEISHFSAPMVGSGEVAAAAITSANAVQAVDALPRDLPVFTVGEATAAAMRRAGREPTLVAGGDGRSVAALIAETVPAGGVVLHLCGRNVREGLAADLTAAGYIYRPAVVYAAVAAEGLSPSSASVIREHRLDAVLLYSPRSSALFVALVRAAGLERELGSVIAACLSEAVAAELAGLHFRSIRVAEAREQNALLRRLEG